MNNKQISIIGIVALIVIVGSFFVVKNFTQTSKSTEDSTPTPEVTYKEVDSSVEATIAGNKAKTKAELTIQGLAQKFSKIEYELTYQTDNNGTQGAFTNDPIDISGQHTFTRSIELGSCSTGGKCSYDKGVRDFKLTAKLHASTGEIFLLRKEFSSL
jgi:hypothetical protein